MKFIVIDKKTKQVKAKHDVVSPPAIKADEELLLWDRIITGKNLENEQESFDRVPVGFVYDDATKTFSQHPEIPVEIDENNEKQKIFRGCGTFFFPPKWIDENVEFLKGVDWEKPEPFYQKIREVIYGTDYQDLSILVCRDGFIGICGTEHKAKGDYFSLDWQRRFLKMLQVIFAIGLLSNKEMLIVRTNDIFQFTKEIGDKEVFQMAMARGAHGSSRDSLFHQRVGIFGRVSWGLSPPRTLININEIETTIETAKGFFGRTEILDDLITLLEAYTHFYYDEFNQSFTLSWVIIEAWVDEKWKDLIDNSEIPIANERIENLKESSSWYASHKSLALFLADDIESDDFKIVDELRRKRNNYLHERKSIEKDDALKCYEFAKKIIKHRLNL